MTKQEQPGPIDQRLVKAIAHPLRVRILEVLSDRVSSPNRLSETLEIGLSDVAYHTRALDKCGCLHLVDTAQRRGATEHFYKATPDSFLGNPAWRGVPSAILPGVSGATLQTFIDKAAAAMQAGTLDGRADTIFRWLPLLLDQLGWDEVVAIMEETTDRVLAAHLRSQDRLSGGNAQDPISAVIGLAAFETGGSRQV
jgi:DNA-binding transcriptional ArsR family regulator